MWGIRHIHRLVFVLALCWYLRRDHGSSPSVAAAGRGFDAFAGVDRLRVSQSGWRLVGEANAIWIFGWSAGLDNGGRRKDEGVQERGIGEVFEIFGVKAKARK